MLFIQNIGRQRVDISLDTAGAESLITFFQEVIDQGKSHIRPRPLANSFFNIRELLVFLDEDEDCQKNCIENEQMCFSINRERADYCICYLQKGLDNRAFFPAEFISITVPTGNENGRNEDIINIYCKLITTSPNTQVVTRGSNS